MGSWGAGALLGGEETMEGPDDEAMAFGAWGNGQALHDPERPARVYEPLFEGCYLHRTAPSLHPPIALRKGQDVVDMIAENRATRCAAVLLEADALVGLQLDRALAYDIFRNAGRALAGHGLLKARIQAWCDLRNLDM